MSPDETTVTEKMLIKGCGVGCLILAFMICSLIAWIAWLVTK